MKHKGPKILILDIETKPIEAAVWGTRQQDIANNQIIHDWNIIAWAAHWAHDTDNKVMYQDLRNSNPRKDKKLLKQIWRLMDQADVILTKNGKRFDEKKLNWRFLVNQMGRPSPYQHIDLEQVSRSKFGPTSQKLDFLTEKVNKKYKKVKNSGMPLWMGCIFDGNVKFWDEMKHYNIYDVLSTKELASHILPWYNPVNLSVYYDVDTCACGSTEFQRRGEIKLSTGIYHRFSCKKCGHWSRGKTNLLDKDRRKNIKIGIR